MSPRFLYADQMLVARIVDGDVVSRKIIPAPETGAHGWLSRMMEMDIDVFICGGADEDFLEEADSCNIRVYHNVAGAADEVIEVFMKGCLRVGHGLLSGADAAPPPRQAYISRRSGIDTAPQPDAVDCIRCVERTCLSGETCPDAGPLVSDMPQDADTRKTLEVAEDVALEIERKLCRVAEVVYFAVGMEYKHLGMAFCIDMFREAEILTHLLRRFFTVTPVCCKFGGLTGDATGLPDGPYNVVCNPAGQAEVLNRGGAELNLIVGLCVGCDVIFTRHSRVPVTTVFVKDRSLANNPVGALYSKYYLKNLMEEIRTR
ncbi:MAG: DUF1847 domain-containing protein [bacterium]